MVALAAFSVIYGKFWLVAHPSPTNLLTKSIAILEQLPDMLGVKEPWKPKFKAPTDLIKTILEVAKCIVDFSELPLQYMNLEGRGMPTAAAHIPIAVYWTIYGMAICTKQTMCLPGMGQEYVISGHSISQIIPHNIVFCSPFRNKRKLVSLLISLASFRDVDEIMEDWNQWSLEHKLTQIHNYLKAQLAVCHQHICELCTLVISFSTSAPKNNPFVILKPNL